MRLTSERSSQSICTYLLNKANMTVANTAMNPNNAKPAMKPLLGLCWTTGLEVGKAVGVAFGTKSPKYEGGRVWQKMLLPMSNWLQTGLGAFVPVGRIGSFLTFSMMMRRLCEGFLRSVYQHFATPGSEIYSRGVFNIDNAHNSFTGFPKMRTLSHVVLPFSSVFVAASPTTATAQQIRGCDYCSLCYGEIILDSSIFCKYCTTIINENHTLSKIHYSETQRYRYVPVQYGTVPSRIGIRTIPVHWTNL